MRNKLGRLFSELRQAPDKRAWLYDQAKWRYFTYRYRQQAQANERFDRLHGVDTAAEMPLEIAGVPQAQVANGNGVYRALTESVFDEAMAAVKLDWERYTFVDIGSDKGKLLLLASNLSFRRIVGIEYAAALHEVAERNVAVYRASTQRCTAIECIYGDALTQPLPDGPLLLFIFNALATPVMRELLDRLDRHARATPAQPLLLVYTNIRSVREMGDVFDHLQQFAIVRRQRRFVVIGNAAARADIAR